MSDNVNRVSRLPSLVAKRTGLLRQLRAVDRDIELLERKQAIAELVATDRINSARTDIPTLEEVLEWDGKFRAEYKAQHEARNTAILATTHQMTGDRETDASSVFTGNAKEVMEHVEGEIEAAEALVTMDVEQLSHLRGDGFEAAKQLASGSPRISTLTCPHTETANVLPWWAGVYQRLGLL